MGKNEKPVSLSWDAFQQLGNPENAPDMPEEKPKEKKGHRANQQVRVHYEKKGRGGKEAVIIRGITDNPDVIKDICKKIKQKLGVGGAVKGKEIIIQGKQRDKIMPILQDMGYTGAKKAGG